MATTSPYRFSDGIIRHLTHKDARQLITLARAVAAEHVDHNTIALARRIARDIEERRLAAYRRPRPVKVVAKLDGRRNNRVRAGSAA